MREFGLIGYPLSHSFSKKYFTEKFEREQIADCSYELFPIPSIEEFPGLLQAHPHFRGLNVTIPYKKLVVPFLDDVSHLPADLQACNCIDFRDGKLVGYNTDVFGFEKSFTAHLKPWHQKALVLGTGGAAAAIWHVLRKLNISFAVVSRNKTAETDFTYIEIDEQVMYDFPVIINTTPLGTYPKTDECPDIPYKAITKQHYLFDVVYNPSTSLFLQKGEEKGASIKNGYDMLLFQAEEAWRIWNA